MSYILCQVNFFNRFGNIYHIKMEILGLKEEFTTLLCALTTVDSTRKC